MRKYFDSEKIKSEILTDLCIFSTLEYENALFNAVCMYVHAPR
jgi:hypothetical protein